MATKKEPELTPVVEAEIIEASTALVPRAHDVISKYLFEERENVDVTSTAKHEQIIKRILGAQSMEDAFEALEPEELENFVGRVVDILEFDKQESDFQEGAPLYVSIIVRDVDAGTKHLINTGEQVIIAQMIWLERNNAMPARMMVHRASKPNKFNRYLCRFKYVEQPNGQS